jgi:hypothetical protein
MICIFEYVIIQTFDIYSLYFYLFEIGFGGRGENKWLVIF